MSKPWVRIFLKDRMAMRNKSHRAKIHVKRWLRNVAKAVQDDTETRFANLIIYGVTHPEHYQ